MQVRQFLDANWRLYLSAVRLDGRCSLGPPYPNTSTVPTPVSKVMVGSAPSLNSYAAFIMVQPGIAQGLEIQSCLTIYYACVELG